MIKNKFVKNTSWILAGQIVKLVISFVISIFTARYLGPSDNGLISYVSSYISFFSAIVGMGLSSVIIYEFVNNRDKEGKILGTAITLRFFASIISTVSFIAFVYIIDGNDKSIMAIAFLQAVQLPFACLDTVKYYYQSKMQSKYSTIVQSAGYLLSSIFKVFLLLTGKSVTWFAFAISLDVIVLGVLFAAFYTKHKTQKLGFSKSIAKRLFVSGLPFILAEIMVVIYGKMDKIMIKQMLHSTADVGLYSVALIICAIIAFIPSAILESARPMLAEAKQESQDKFNLRFRQLSAGIFWLCVMYSLFIMLFSKYILYFLYGQEYLGANSCLKIAVWYTTFSYIGSARCFWLVCENKKKYVFVFSAIGAFCNLIMNVIMIPIWGINGAALATFITEVLANFVVPSMFKDTREYAKCILDAILLRNIQLREISHLIRGIFNKK